MKQWLVHIGAGKWQTAAIKETRNRGLSILAVDGDENAEGFAYADATLHINITDVEATLEGVTAFFSEIDASPVGALCIASEAGQLAAGKIRDHYGLKGLSYEMAKRLTDKSIQRQLWSNSTFSPEFIVVKSADETLSTFEELPDSIIVKPVDSAGSRGITVLSDYKPRDLANAVDFALNYSKSSKVIIERYIEGQEYTLESVVIEGKTYPLVITEKHKVQGTNGTVANKLASANINSSLSAKITNVVAQGHEALTYLNGVSHAEVIVDTDSKVWIVEIAGRGAGFAVSEKYIEFCTGYPYLKVSIDFCMNEIICKPENLTVSPSCIRFFETVEGKLKKFSVPPMKNVESSCLIDEGTVMAKATTDGDRIGYVMVRGNTQKEFVALLKEVESRVKVELYVE